MTDTSQGINISRYILGNNAKSSNIRQPTVNYRSDSIQGGIPMKSGIARIISYILAILIVILVILLFINYFITPIFKLKPGDSGIITIPGFDDGKLYWNKTNASQILNKDLPISSIVYNYTINLDIFIENPLQFSKHPRIFFSRGAIRNENPTGDTLLGLFSNYNIIAGLLPDTNDLVVSVLNKDNNMENVIIQNIPIQEPFRLGVVVMERAMEIYINGHLKKTRTFEAPPKDVKGDIEPALGIESNIAKIRNLKIWPRILTINQIREATPSLSSTKDFGGVGPIPTSTSCANSAMNTTNNMLDRFSKLSV